MRELSDGVVVKVEQPVVRAPGSGGTTAMNQFLEAAGIALNAIWTNKLRSFLTVLGNIVAVTSIIAVVSLIQGMNAYVTKAILSDVGADTFQVQRVPDHPDRRGVRQGPQQPAPDDRRRARHPRL